MRSEPESRWPSPPDVDPEEVIRFYASKLEAIDGVLALLPQVRGHVLRFFTLIRDDREVERQVHGAELAVHDQWPDVEIEFKVFHQGCWLPPELEAAWDVSPIAE